MRVFARVADAVAAGWGAVTGSVGEVFTATNFANSVTGIFAHLQGINVDWQVTAAFVAAAMAASLAAGYFGTKTDTTRLQRWFAYLVFAVAAYVLVDTLILN